MRILETVSFRTSISRIVSSEQGNMLVEFAFALPILVFLLFAGVDGGRYILLGQKADQAALAAVDALTGTSAFSEEDLRALLRMTESTFGTGGGMLSVKVSLTNYVFLPDGTHEVNFDQSEGAIPVLCRNSDRLPQYEVALEEPSAPKIYVYRVKICVVAADSFFLSSFLPLKNTAFSSLAFGFGKHRSDFPVTL